MRLLYADDFRLCVLDQGQAIDISQFFEGIRPEDQMAALVADFDSHRDRIAAHVAAASGPDIGTVRVRAPIPRPRNIVCMATNYMENGTLPEPKPINAFHKAPNAVIGPDETMILPDAPASNFECEAEIAVVIGKRAYNVDAADAMGHIFGYVPFMDGSARGLPPSGNVFFQAKSRETFAPMGPWIVTADEVPDPYDISVKLWVNGELKQDYHTSDMAHDIARCIEWASHIHALEPGDILACGTNHGGLSSIQDGDRIELECSGIGRLGINVRDDLKRTWPRDTRLERKTRGLPELPKQLTGKYATEEVS